MRCGNRLARCHVTGQDCSRLTPLLWLQISSRLVLCVHFASELVDKFANWDEWVTVIQNSGFPGPTYMLCLVVGLLMVGTPMLAGGVFLRWAAGLLLLFTIPVNLVMGQQLVPSQAGTVSALMMGFAWGSAGLIFIPLVGWAADRVGLGTAMACVSAFPVLGFFLARMIDEDA